MRNLTKSYLVALATSFATVMREYVDNAIKQAALKGERGEKGEPGPRGEPGVDGDDGVDGERGPAGEKGADGKSVTVEDFRQLFEAEHAKWTLDFERRASDQVQKFLEKIPKPLDGKDGFGFDDLSVLHDGERQVTLRFARGDQVKEFPIVIPALIERGVFKRGSKYERGDGVTHGGSFWIAQVATQEVPGDAQKDWRLSVKKGRDGKDGERGPRGEQGAAGKDGRDLTQMGTDGSKW